MYVGMCMTHPGKEYNVDVTHSYLHVKIHRFLSSFSYIGFQTLTST
jgi:hypothetical protein